MIGRSKLTQRKMHAENAINNRWHKEGIKKEAPLIADPKMMAISCVENGSTFTQSRGILAAQGIESPPKSTYYYHQKKVNSTIKQLCEQSLKKEAENMKPNSTISLDGAYAHRRNSSMCHAAFINHENNKIVAGSVVTKTRKGGNFSGSSNMLESECIKRNIKQIEINKVNKFCHDRDNKSRDLMKNANPNMEEIIDVNHAKKGFETIWKKLINGVYHVASSSISCVATSAVSIAASTVNVAATIGKATAKVVEKGASVVCNVEYRKNFNGLKTHVKRWFEYLLKKKDLTTEQKLLKWKNVEHHVLGDHSACQHRKAVKYVWKKGVQSKELRDEFHLFTEEAAEIFNNVNPKVTTNPNESLNAAAARIANKSIPWGKDSYEARIAYTYLKHNEPENCSLMIREKNKVKINDIDLKFITERAEDRMSRKEIRSSSLYQQNELKRRTKFKSEMSKNKKGDYSGVPYTKLCKDNDDK